ncbi:MAG TPA: hypothetical protein VLL48_04355, partial [Longimicrobiales bacterium]|nr:hypothetical protein [Longimicrobiales bacterium]
MLAHRALATAAVLTALTLTSACAETGGDGEDGDVAAVEPVPGIDLQARLDQYATVRLTADLGALTGSQREMIPLLMEAADHMDPPYWHQAWGDPGPLLGGASDPALRRYLEINYGPWDRLAGDEPFVAGVGPKPAGANFYPEDMTVEELEAAATASEEREETLTSLYTLVRRADDGSLTTIPYHEAYAEHVRPAARALREAAALSENEALRRYLELRADALLDDEYRESDMAWLDMKDNTLELVIGPIETYEDQLFGYKAAYEAYVLIKDREWSERLGRFAALLPDMQRNLPVPERFKGEMPGTDSDLNAYDVIYYRGQANAGSKTIAINLPNDEEVQLAKGTRRLQLKNAMRAKFDRILVPIAEVLIAEDQRRHVTFDAFFGNTMFHEVAHGLGIKNTVDGEGTVRETLREHYTAMEEGKADVLGLYLVTRLREMGEITEGSLEDDYVTFLASIFRSVRFGASSAHGRANMVRFDVFRERGAFTRDEATGTYRVDMERMGEAMRALAGTILRIQGDGDHAGAGRLLA